MAEPSLTSGSDVPGSIEVSELQLEVEYIIRRHKDELLQYIDGWASKHMIYVPSADVDVTNDIVNESVISPDSSPRPPWKPGEPCKTLHVSEESLKEPISIVMTDAGKKQAKESWKQGTTYIHGVVPDARPSPGWSISGAWTNHGWSILEAWTKVFRERKKKKVNSFLFQNNRADAFAAQSRMQHLASHWLFEAFSGFLIIANAVLLGLETQAVARSLTDDTANGSWQDHATPTHFIVFTVFFNTAFAVELAIRWIGDGTVEFFCTSDCSWNVFDMVVVSAGILDLLSMAFPPGPFGGSEIMSNTSMLRVIRVIRIVRVAKVIRVVQFFRELRMMVFALLMSFKSVIWASMVLGILWFTVAISLTSAVVERLNSQIEASHPENTKLLDYFGTLDRSILSLYMAMSGGLDWGDLYLGAIVRLPFLQRAVFLLYILYVNLAVVNIVTAIFVDVAIQSNQKDRDIIVQEELQDKASYMECMRSVFEEMDDDCTQGITLQEFERKLDDARVIAYFNFLKLDVSDARKLFYLLDFDQSGEIDVDEFLQGCHRLRGESRALDTALMQYEVRWLREGIGEFMKEIRNVRATVNLVPSDTQGRHTTAAQHNTTTVPGSTSMG